MTAHKIRVLVADDHALFRSGLKSILSSCPRVAHIDEAATGSEVLTKYQKKRYDCVLLDIHMPGEHGIEILKRLKKFDPDVHVLVLSMYPVDQYGIRVFRAGASGYLTKDVDFESLQEAVLRIANGQRYIQPGLAQKIGAEIKNGNHELAHERLSDRELQVLTLLASGKSVSQIARELSLSVKTISSHRVRILAKMGMKNNAELIRYAVENSLVY